MQEFEADYITEPILWLIAAFLFFQLGIYFFNKYRKSEQEARAFFSGTVVFFFSYALIRTIEVIRRYFIVGYYYDIEDFWYNGGTLTDVSLYLRLAFLLISWAGIAYFYFRIEGTILERKTFYILTFASILKFIINPLLYFPTTFDFNTFSLINAILFIITGFFPTVLFGVFAFRNYVEKRKSWILLTIGLFCYIIGETGSNPEAYMITANMNQLIVHYGSPLMVILSAILMSIALKGLYEENTEENSVSLRNQFDESAEIKKLREEITKLKYIIVILLALLMVAFMIILVALP
ncbi:MAG: hypothetical protein ACTSYB_10455 [Candidatus Helarchaeota archaeon]